MFLSFIRYELLSFEHGNPISHKMYNIILLLFVRIQSSFFQPEVLHFRPIYFSIIVSISGKPYLLLDSKKFNLCMYILRTEKQDGSKLTFMPFEIVSICVWHLVQCVIASYAEVWTFQFWWKFYQELSVTMPRVPEGAAVSPQGQHYGQYKGHADQRRSFKLSSG